MTGYDINKVFKESLNYFWVAQTSQIYSELQNLKKEGWVEYEDVEQKQKPDKKIFSITDLGKRELQNCLLNYNVDFPTRNEVLMKTFFMGKLNKNQIKEFFNELLKNLEQEKIQLDKTNEIIENYGKNVENKDSLLWSMTADYGKMHIDMDIKWIKSCLGKLGEE